MFFLCRGGLLRTSTGLWGLIRRYYTLTGFDLVTCQVNDPEVFWYHTDTSEWSVLTMMLLINPMCSTIWQTYLILIRIYAKKINA